MTKPVDRALAATPTPPTTPCDHDWAVWYAGNNQCSHCGALRNEEPHVHDGETPVREIPEASDD